MPRTPYARQKINSKDIVSVVSVLKSDFLTTGPKIIEFEKKLSNIFNAKYSSAVNSATSALHLACLALGLKKGDYLWTTPISFVASANCGLYCSAKVDFVDIDNENFNISVSKLKKKLEKTPKTKLPKIIVVVHLSGHPVDLKSIKNLSKKYKFKIIEDASHAVGSTYNGTKIGNCKYSDICIFSFHPIKIITTGEGGAMLTNSKKVYDKFSLLRSHGIDKSVKSNSNPWYYNQTCLGYNYRMNEIEAALGVSQLSNLDKFVKERNRIAEFYRKNLDSSNIKFQQLVLNSKSSMHLFIIRVNSLKRNQLFKELKKNYIDTNLHYIPIYRHSFYNKIRVNLKSFKNSEDYYKEAISIPLYFGLKKNVQIKIIKIINRVVAI